MHLPFGLTISRTKREPFGRLLKVPRYEERTVDLVGRPFTVADTRSFFFSHREIFGNEVYRFDTENPAPRIIDCGANYGTSVVYFKTVYPNARITAVEADPRISICSLGTVSTLTSSCFIARDGYPRPSSVRERRPDAGRDSVLPELRASSIVAAVTLDDLVDGPVDFLKIDIEGAESAALAACNKLGLVKQLFVEYHSLEHSAQTLGELLGELRDAGFRYYIHQQFCSPRPLTLETRHLGMDMQLDVFARRPQRTAVV